MSVTVRLPAAGRRAYHCDPSAHRVIVSDELGRPCFEFGGRGQLPGQLDTPLDITVVAPEFHGERLPEQADDLLWLAVADYGNRRVQIFELDGCFVGTIVDDGEMAAFGGPCQLTWRSPVLDVEYADGRRISVHLAAALLCEATGILNHQRAAALTLASGSEARH